MGHVAPPPFDCLKVQVNPGALSTPLAVYYKASDEGFLVGSLGEESPMGPDISSLEAQPPERNFREFLITLHVLKLGQSLGREDTIGLESSRTGGSSAAL